MNEASETEQRGAISWWYLAAGVPLALLAIVLLTRGGRQSSGGPNVVDPLVEEIEATQRDELFDYAIESINRQEEFSTSEMLKQAVDRLDNWIHDQKPPAGWQPDPMLATLPKPLRELPGMNKLDELAFTLAPPSADGWTLQEAVWLRDLSNWARGDEVGDLQRAKRLFDWTVRNIQLDLLPETDGQRVRAMQKPWETLMLGQGSPQERAWVFVLLARNQGLDAAMIGPADTDDGEAQEASARLVGVLSGDQLYLFDPELGLPVPAPDGVKLDKAGRLVVEPASLEQVVADDALLRRLDADDDHRYLLPAAQLDGAVAWLECSPAQLSLRMKLVESRLAGKDKLVLTTNPTAQAKRFKRCEQIGEVRLWTRPYRTALQEAQHPADREAWRFSKFMPFQVGVGQPSALWKGRSYHLKGRLEGSPSAITYYQAARPSNKQLIELKVDDQMKQVLLFRKLSASYWLGLVAAHQGNNRAAIDYLETRMLKVTMNNPWLHGAVYNMARILEADQVQLAIGLYLADADSPAHHGNLLRARWLQDLTGVEPIKLPVAKPAEPSKKRPDAPAEQGAGTGSF